MSEFSDLIAEELTARNIQPHILQIFMNWSPRRYEQIMHGENRLLIKEVVRMAQFFDVPWMFIWKLSRRTNIRSAGCQEGS